MLQGALLDVPTHAWPRSLEDRSAVRRGIRCCFHLACRLPQGRALAVHRVNDECLADGSGDREAADGDAGGNQTPRLSRSEGLFGFKSKVGDELLEWPHHTYSATDRHAPFHCQLLTVETIVNSQPPNCYPLSCST